MDSELLARMRAKWNKFFSDLEYEKRVLEAHAQGIPESDLPENREFMEEACESWGNNGEPMQPEDCDVDEASFESGYAPEYRWAVDMMEEDDGECHCYDCKESK